MKTPKSTTACPITKVAKLLSDTWTMLIMHYLLKEPRHFCELERSLPGISTRTLTLKLRKLVALNMLKKTKDGLYTATRKGEGLKLVEKAMKSYQERFL